jgi:hypothetical protein
MPGRSEHRTSRSSLLAVVTVYGLVIAACAFLHHDFACHENSRTHCPSCQVSQHAQKVEASAAVIEAVLRPAGRLETYTARPIETLAPPRLAGRSPPA